MDQNKELRKAGLKVTHPRLLILKILQDPAHQHVSAEEVYRYLLDANEDIGLATTYRALNQFEDDVIEQCQKDIAANNLMTLTHHSLYLCGECKDGCEKQSD